MEDAQNPSGSENCPKIRQIVVIKDHQTGEEWPAVVTAVFAGRSGKTIGCTMFTMKGEQRLLHVPRAKALRPLGVTPGYTWRRPTFEDLVHRDGSRHDMFDAAVARAKTMEKAAAADVAEAMLKPNPVMADIMWKKIEEGEAAVQEALSDHLYGDDEPCPTVEQQPVTISLQEHHYEMAKLENRYLDAMRALLPEEVMDAVVTTADKIGDMITNPGAYVRVGENENDWHGRWRSVVDAMDEILPKRWMEIVLKRAESGGYS